MLDFSYNCYLYSGVSHGDESKFVFDGVLTMSDDDQIVSERMTQAWANFVIYG